MKTELFLFLGLLAVASNPSPYFAALGLVGGSGAGCVILAKEGVGFLSLVLFLVYLGGMMVVFAYCAALVAEPYPKAWGSWGVMVYLGVYNAFLLFLWMTHKQGEAKMTVLEPKWEVGCLEWWGTGDLLCRGGWVLGLGGGALLLTLFMVLEVVRGYKWGVALRAV